MKDTKGTQNFFLLKAKLQIIREILIASKRACKAKDHEKEKKQETKEQNNKRSKQWQKARFLSTRHASIRKFPPVDVQNLLVTNTDKTQKTHFKIL